MEREGGRESERRRRDIDEDREGQRDRKCERERETERVRDRQRQTDRQSGNESMCNNIKTHLSCNSLHFAKDMQTYNKCHFSRWNYRNNRPGQHNEWRYMIHELSLTLWICFCGYLSHFLAGV